MSIFKLSMHLHHSEWETAIVPIVKKDNSTRLCGDYETTINPQLRSIAPPRINIKDILANLSGGVSFSTIDLAQACDQLALCEESKEVLTLSTHKGLFKQNGLPFGITSAPAIWHNTIANILPDLNGVQVYLDGTLATKNIWQIGIK